MLTNKNLHLSILIFLILSSIAMLFINLGEKSIYAYDESYYSYNDLEMVQSEKNIFLPESRNLKHLYTIKPPLKSWLKYPILKIFGFSTFNLRVLDALFGLGAVLLTYLLGAKYFNKATGLIGAFALLTTKALHVGWAKFNLYDSGMIFFMLLFIYFFSRSNEYKYNYIWTGLALAGVFSMKHIMGILALLIFFFYLLANKNLKYIFSKKFWLMIGTAFVPIAIWVVLFQIQTGNFISTFIETEISRRVVGGYNKSYIHPLFYFKSLSYFGLWKHFLYPALIFTTYKVFRKKDKNLLFLLFWFLGSIILLSFASTKMGRYIYYIYPAATILIGYMISELIKYLFKIKKKVYKLLSYSVIILVFGVSVFAWISSFNITLNPRKFQDHHFVDFYRDNPEYKIYLNNLHMKSFHLHEIVHLGFIKNNLVESKKSLNEELQSIAQNDSIIISKRMYLEYLDQGLFDNMDLLYFTYTPDYQMWYRLGKMIKVALTKRNSMLEKYLRNFGIDLYETKKLVTLDIISNKSKKALLNESIKRILGFNVNDDSYYYLMSLLTEKIINRVELIDLLQNYIKISDSCNRSLANPRIYVRNRTQSRPFKWLKSRNLVKRVKFLCFTKEELRLNAVVLFEPEFKKIWRWRWYPFVGFKMFQKLTLALNDDDAIVIPLDIITKWMRTKKIDFEKYDQFEFCNFYPSVLKKELPKRIDIEESEDEKLYPDLVIVVRTKTKLYRQLLNEGAVFNKFKKRSSKKRVLQTYLVNDVAQAVKRVIPIKFSVKG